MKLAIPLLLLLASLASAEDKSKPVLLIQGEGNITTNSRGGAVGGRHWASVHGSTNINKHDQTMEMAQDLLQVCPSVETTLDGTVVPDYYVALNREGYGSWNIGQSQIMLLNRRKTVLFVAKKGTVKNAVKSVCNAIAADWQTHGRLAVSPPATFATPVVPTPAAATAPKSDAGEPPTPALENADRTTFQTATTPQQPSQAEQPIPRIMRTTLGGAATPAALKLLGITGEINPIYGFRILAVAADSPAQRAGLMVNDYLLAVNGKPVKNADDIAGAIASSPEGAVVTINKPQWLSSQTQDLRVVLE